MNEELMLTKNSSSNLKDEDLPNKRNISVEKKTISIHKSDLESIELINSILEKCNKSNLGRAVTLSDVVLYSIRKLKDSDFELIKESTLTVEETAEKALLDFNQRNGTSLTLIELAMKQLKRERKEIVQSVWKTSMPIKINKQTLD